MELSKTQKILLGVLSVWPPVYIFVFIASIFGLILFSAGKPGDGNELSPFFGGGIVLLMLLHFITIFLTLGLTVFYVVHAVKNNKLDSNMRIIWIICFFFGGMIAEPIYWYLQIWKEPQRSIDQLASPPASGWAHHQEVRESSYAPPNEPPDWR